MNTCAILKGKEETAMPLTKGDQFARQLRKRRTELNLSLRELAERSGVGYSLLSYIESGERPAPRGQRLSDLAKALELPVTDLYSWAGMEMDLPSAGIYLRSKYSLTKKDAEDLARFIEERAEALRKKGGHGGSKSSR
ncbi:MAG: helix-turn-helix domain-containing protein [Actinomycetota bacterium]